MGFQVSVALQPLWRIRAAVNHFQLVAIMRLLSWVSTFVDQLVADQKFFSISRTNGGGGVAVGVICIIEEVFLSPLYLPRLPGSLFWYGSVDVN